jgi:diguanylate cyclase (GGDEF)-like protein
MLLRSSRPLPRLLPLVFCISVLLAAISCAALATLGSSHVVAGMTSATVAADQAVVRAFLTGPFMADGLAGAGLPDNRRAQLEAGLTALARQHSMDGVWLLTTDGAIVARSLGAEAGTPGGPGTIEPTTTAVIEERPASAVAPARSVLVETLAIVADGQSRLVMVIQRDASAIVSAANATWADVLLITVGAALVLLAVLYLIFRASHFRLLRQEAQIRESERRDPLTGLLNHGAVIRQLTLAITAAERHGDPLGVLLLDIDNFKLLNAVHGDAAGDVVLREVATAVDRQCEGWLTFGRFGPDEFLAVAAGAKARALEATARTIQADLAKRTVQFGDSERLAVTISAGISYYPFHASSINDLLSSATVTLGGARAGGGNEVRVADAHIQDLSGSRPTFDVLQGLVVAVDSKDRYTKRHSDEVASYSLFLASWLGLSVELRQALETAALLHDVGKIGVPEEILRKPGRLTAAEHDVLKQHVVLGDMIVRDLPDIELVRLGLLHHHERWDGEGYLGGLAGDKIPLIARLIAVGDAFSAMTTNRPYRSALPTEEAIRRLREAAGSQLDPELVAAFVEGIALAPDAPLPGTNRVRPMLWTRKIAAA